MGTFFHFGVRNGVRLKRKMAEKMGDLANFVVPVKKAKISEKTGMTGVNGGLLDLRFLMRNRGCGFNG